MKLIPSIGSLTSTFAIVGQAPAEEELLKGIPFCGQSGKWLDICLKKAGVRRDDTYIDNLFQYKIDKIESFIDLHLKNPVETEMYEEAKEALYERLSQTSANIIVSLGQEATYALTNIHPTSITSRRGSLYWNERLQKKILPAVHPAVIVRGDYLAHHLLTWDLQKAREEALTASLNLPTPILQIHPSYEETMEYLEQASKASFLTFDIEGVHFIRCISFCFEKHKAISIAFFNENGRIFSVSQATDIWLKIGEILETSKIKKCNQNILYDLSALHRLYGFVPQNLECTLIAQKTLYPDFSCDLGFITRMWTRYNYYKDEGHDYIRFGKGNLDNFFKYSAMDAIIPFLAFPQQVNRLKIMENFTTYLHQKTSIDAILYMQAQGVCINEQELRERDIELTAKLDEKISAVKEKIPYVEITRKKKGESIVKTEEFNPVSPSSVSAYFYNTLGLPKPKVKGKEITTSDDEMLHKFLSKGFKVAQDILEIRALQTHISNYLRVILDPLDGNLRCAFNPAGTESGRWSSSKFLFSYGRNLHNLPKKTDTKSDHPFRQFLKADEGKFWVKFDLSMAELRIFAYIAPEYNIIKALETGLDPYKSTYADMFNIPLSEVTKDQRSIIGKPFTLGGNYGMSYKKMAEKYGFDYKEAFLLMKKFHSARPGVKRYSVWIEQELKKSHTLLSLLGRKRTFLNRLTTADERGVNALYYIPQSTVGDIITRYGINKTYSSQDTLPEVDLRLQVHDEIDFQLPLNLPFPRILEILFQIKKNFEQPLYWKGRSFVIPAEAEIGFDLWNMIELKPFTESRISEAWNELNAKLS